MTKPNDTRPPYSNLLTTVIVVLVVAITAIAVFLWADFWYSCGSRGPTSATVTIPTSTEPPTSSTTTEPPSTTTTTILVSPLDFDGPAAMGHIEALAQDIGPRKSGTQAEEDAFVYAANYLQGLGYDVQAQQVTLPGGLTSRNLVVTKPGLSDSVILLGGHIDSVAGAPGGNDNASGVAVVLELARDFFDADVVPTLQFVVFGAEEMTDSNADHHHYGSRQFVEGMTEEERSALAGMISLDMVGYGSVFTVRTMNRGPRLLSDMAETYSDANGLPARYLKDGGKYGWSDHEPFELAGYPAVWLEWREDPTYHTSRDTYAHCDPDDVRRVGEMVVGFLDQLTQTDLDALIAARGF